MVDYQTSPPDANSSPETQQAPAVASFQDRLADIRDTAQQLRVNAEWLAIDADGLLSDLKVIVEDPAAPGNGALAALDSATWLHRATENVEAEFSTLIDHLYAVTEA